jgi:small subunit ribosomal protein S6
MARIRHYETMFIVKTTLDDEETQAQIAKVRFDIEKNGGEIIAYENTGIKDLAYEIQKNKRGYYYVAYFIAPTESIVELERNFNTNETILRHMFVKYESKKEIAQWTAMSLEASKKAK